MIKRVAWLAFFCILAVSCLDDPDCFNLNNNIIQISFQKLSDRRADTVSFISVTAAGFDSAFYSDNIVIGGIVRLPLNYLEDQTRFIFETPEGTHELVLGYSAKSQFVSKDCGERFVVSGLRVIESTFDSVRVISSQLSTRPSTNIVIYRCPVNSNVKFSFRQLYPNDEPLGQLFSKTITSISANYPGGTFEGGNGSTVILPLNENAASTQFNFNFSDRSNTIELGYESEDDIVFLACGTQRLLKKLTINSHNFPMVEVINDSIYDPPVTNIAFMECAPDTNLFKLRVTFKRSTATNAPNATLTIRKIRVGNKEIFAGGSISFFDLPLDPTVTSLTYSFEFESGIKNLHVQYVPVVQVFHDVCSFTTYSSIQVLSSDFQNANVLLNSTAYPTNLANIAIVN